MDRHVDVEELFNPYEVIYKPYEDTPEEILRLLERSKDKRYRMKTIKSGTMLESDTYPLLNNKVINKAKKIIKEYDAEQRKAYYQRTRRKNIVRLIQANFSSKDMWIHLTYRDGVEPKNDKEAKDDAIKYIRRLKYQMDKNGWGKLKYVYVIEGSTNRNGTRYHIHIVSNFPDLDLAKAKWEKGKYPKVDRLTPDEDTGLERLANYLTKEADDEDKPDKPTKKKKSYGYSLNLYKSWQHATVADSRMTRARAEKLVTGQIDAKAFYEKLYEGYKYQRMEVRTSEYISGFYISVKMCLKVKVKRE